MENEVTAKSYTLKEENGGWLGQVVLTSDGAFMAITDYGNFSFAWRSTGEKDFREFILRLDTQYFAGKMAIGMGYVMYGPKIDKAAYTFAEKILPALKDVLREEINSDMLSSPNTDIKHRPLHHFHDEITGEQESLPEKDNLAILWNERKKAIIAKVDDIQMDDAGCVFKAVNNEWYKEAILFRSPKQYLVILNKQ